MNQKKYVDIERLKESYANAFTIGEHIVIQTKVDGANASFTYDLDTDSVKAFSRKKEVSPMNNLRGFYEYIMRFPKYDIQRITKNGRYIIFGEWLVSHTVKYPDEAYNIFYMFDVFDTHTSQYVKYDIAKNIFDLLYDVANKNEITFKFVPVLYDGELVSWENVYDLLKISTTGASPCEEGIVIKSQDRLDKIDSRTPSYVKIVATEFSEVAKQKKQKEIDPASAEDYQRQLEIVKTVVTKRRVEKIIQKMVDEGIIPETWDCHDMSNIMKIAPKLVYEDCMKEEKETVLSCNKFGKICGSLTGTYVRELLQER